MGTQLLHLKNFSGIPGCSDYFFALGIIEIQFAKPLKKYY